MGVEIWWAWQYETKQTRMSTGIMKQSHGEVANMVAQAEELECSQRRPEPGRTSMKLETGGQREHEIAMCRRENIYHWSL